jgi:hypothetical protein
MAEVESSIVCKNVSRLIESASESSIKRFTAEESVALLNFNLPVPGSEFVVSEIN